MTTLSILMSLLLGIGVLLLWSRGRSVRSRLHVERDAALAEVIQTSDARQEALAEQIRTLSDVNHKLTIELEETRRKLRETQGIIGSVCEQRDGWKNWYYRQASEHSSAQEYLANSIEGLLSFIRKNESKIGRLPKFDPGFRAIIQEFAATHPALADRGEPAHPGSPPPGTTEITSNPQG